MSHTPTIVIDGKRLAILHLTERNILTMEISRRINFDLCREQGRIHGCLSRAGIFPQKSDPFGFLENLRQN